METKERTENIDEDITEEEEQEFIQELPLLPLDDLVVFPYMPPVPPFPPHHVALTGKMATTAVERAMESERMLCIFRPKKHLSKEDIKKIKKSNLSPIGSLIHILRYKTDDEDVLFLAHGRERVEIEEILHTDPFVKARVNIISSDDEYPIGNPVMDLEVEALVRSNDEMFQRIVQMSSRYQEEYGSLTKTMIDEPGRLADYIAAMLDLKPHDKQRVLEAVSVHERLNTLAVILAKELDLHELEAKSRITPKPLLTKDNASIILENSSKPFRPNLVNQMTLDLRSMKCGSS